VSEWRTQATSNSPSPELAGKYFLIRFRHAQTAIPAVDIGNESVPKMAQLFFLTHQHFGNLKP